MPNFHIKRAKLDGYRNIRGTEATFCDGLNIIIGPNGCGKSNFLWFLNEAQYPDESNMVDFEYSASIEYYLTMFPNDKSQIEIQKKYVEKDNKISLRTSRTFYRNDKEQSFNTVFDHAASDEIRWTSLLLDFNIPIEIECFSKPTDTEIVQRGKYALLITSNPILNNIFENDYHNQFQSDFIDFSDTLKKQVAAYTPVKDIRVKNRIMDIKEDYEKTIKFHSLFYEFQTEDGRYYTWNELSDGTRRIVWLVLNILTTAAKVILIEEPELGIHPHQLSLLMLFIKEQSETKQFIITTHSPEVLNVIESDELDRIKIARYDAERKTTVIENIPEKRQKLIQKHLAKTGQLSDYWVHVNLEGTHKWTK